MAVTIIIPDWFLWLAAIALSITAGLSAIEFYYRCKTRRAVKSITRQ
jgi:hypothetical protein